MGGRDMSEASRREGIRTMWAGPRLSRGQPESRSAVSPRCRQGGRSQREQAIDYLADVAAFA